ncbi:hypothetical protein niasHT_022306 [Heterodera trifolii]|uniref:Uncharacterized protein n=1 Tax=Heterodera trifolii TaxID=157864 RepID=A0ABD2KNR4_9BILA
MFSSAAIPSHPANEHLLLLRNWKRCNFGREQNNHFAKKKSQSAIVSPTIGTHKPNIQIEINKIALFGVPPFQIDGRFIPYQTKVNTLTTRNNLLCFSGRTIRGRFFFHFALLLPSDALDNIKLKRGISRHLTTDTQ